MSRFLHAGGHRPHHPGRIDARYVAFPIPGAPREHRPTSTAAAARTLARLCPSADRRRRLSRLTPQQNEALALTELENLSPAEAAEHMGLTFHELEAVLGAALLCLSPP